MERDRLKLHKTRYHSPRVELAPEEAASIAERLDAVAAFLEDFVLDNSFMVRTPLGPGTDARTPAGGSLAAPRMLESNRPGAFLVR